MRRVGKTVLCRQLEGVEYFNCDLPSVQRQVSDPEFFIRRLRPGTRLVLDEVHRLADPSLALRFAADELPALRILATGSSTLAATRKFRDSLTGRKRSVHLLPVLWTEAEAFGVSDLDRRLLHGGLPEMLLAGSPSPAFFEEWLDSYYARDIQELFAVRSRTAFQTLLKLALLRSTGQLDISDLAKESGVSRPTVMSYLDAIEIAHAVARVPPYHGGGRREIVARPKLFGFDTGRYDPASLEVFRSLYPAGRDFLVCPYVGKPYALHRGTREITACGASNLPD